MQATKQPLNLYSKNDICVLDNLKGVSIILIFMYHSLFSEYTIPFLPIMVPIFAFASGFAFKGNDLTAYVKKVFSIYLLGNLIYLPQRVWFMARESDWNESNMPLLIAGPNSPVLWYLLALILWAVCARFFVKCKHPLLAALIAIALVAYPFSHVELTGKSEHYWPLLGNTILAIKIFFFFLLGVVAPWEKLLQLRRFKFKHLGIVLCIPLMLIFKQSDYYPMHPNFWQAPLYLGVCAICTATMIAVFPGYRITFLTDFGKSSLNIYLLHMWPLFLFYDIAYHLEKVFPPAKTFRPMLAGLMLCFSLYLFSSRKISLWINNAILRIEAFLFQKEVRTTT